MFANKAVMQTYGFRYVGTLNVLHYFMTVVLLEFLAYVRKQESGNMPAVERTMVGAMSVVSVQLQNTSLSLNSVGSYQLAKMLVIPASMLLERCVNGISRKYTTKVVFGLATMSLGVVVSGVHDVQLKPLGCFVALSATFITAQFQIWQGSKQQQFSINAMQLSRAFSLPQLLVGIVVAVPFDVIYGDLLSYKPSFGFAVAMTLSCIAAVGVQVTSTGLIGKTSPVTYQVVGQVKMVATVVGGYIWFDAEHPAMALLGKLVGFVLAVTGASLYANQRLVASGQANDWLACFDGKPSEDDELPR